MASDHIDVRKLPRSPLKQGDLAPCTAPVPTGSSAIVQICNALLKDVLPPAVQDPELNYVRVKQLMNAVVGNQVKPSPFTILLRKEWMMPTRRRKLCEERS